jgi:hypothetical protein
MKNFKAPAWVVLFVVGLLFGHTSEAQAQGARTAARALITKVRLDNNEGAHSGAVYVTIRGAERKIADDAFDAWIIEGGRRVVYSGRDGSGGFEDEGQSLRIYDARTGRQRKIMSEYVGVDKVTEVTTSTKKTALLVAMSDGGLGASYLAVVDPERGEVFFRRWVRLLSRRGDIITMGHYKEDDWEDLNSDQTGNAKVKPYKRERQNLNALLKGRVIFNKRDRP